MRISDWSSDVCSSDLDLISIAIGRTVFDEAETGPEIEGSGVFEGERHFVLTHHTGVHCILTGEIAAIGEPADGKRVGAGGGRGEGEHGIGGLDRKSTRLNSSH